METTVAPGFQLFVSTRNFNPVFSPELLASMTLVDFNVTVKGLEDQLLARVITFEREVSHRKPLASKSKFTQTNNHIILFLEIGEISH